MPAFLFLFLLSLKKRGCASEYGGHSFTSLLLPHRHRPAPRPRPTRPEVLAAGPAAPACQVEKGWESGQTGREQGRRGSGMRWEDGSGARGRAQRYDCERV